jgi:hypothetical protein
MAKRLFEQPSITLHGSDVGADVFSAELLTGRRAAVDVTGLSNTYDEFLSPNLRNWSVRLNYFNNITCSSASTPGITTILRLVYQSSATTGVAFVLRQTTAGRSEQNNEWSGQVQIDGSFSPISGDVATADKGSVTLKGLGILTWATSTS